MLIKCEYSEAEKKLISAISPHWSIIASQTSIDPWAMYKILMENCFIENRQGPEIEALRRVVTALSKCTPYRMTPEFDKLCEF
jgi:hypothetical protein